MNLPVILDIAIGLIFIYLILSLLASEIQELITTLLQWRAKHLKKSIESLLAGGSESTPQEIQDSIKLVKELYNDPLINTLNHEAKEEVETRFRDFSRRLNNKKIADRNSAPSYIPSETFAVTLLQVLKIPDLIKKLNVSNGGVKTNLNMMLAFYKEIKTAIQNKESESYKKIKEVYGDIDEELETTIKNAPDSLINSLSILAKRAQIKVEEIDEQMDQFQKEIETWFDRSMERATGVYKRNAKGVAILIGLTVAVFTNTDTLYVVSRLSKDSAVRTAITQSASQRPDFNDPNVRNQFYKDLEGTSLPIGWTSANLNQQFSRWNSFNTNQQSSNLKRFNLLGIWQLLTAIAGWILSGIAIAMGASFWFDLLGKVINVRNTGPRPVAYTKDQPPSNDRTTSTHSQS